MSTAHAIKLVRKSDGQIEWQPEGEFDAVNLGLDQLDPAIRATHGGETTPIAVCLTFCDDTDTWCFGALPDYFIKEGCSGALFRRAGRQAWRELKPGKLKALTIGTEINLCKLHPELAGSIFVVEAKST